jgi:hypothetical protein
LAGRNLSENLLPGALNRSDTALQSQLVSNFQIYKNENTILVLHFEKLNESWNIMMIK